ncbi:NUDIX domain-containing protein [Bacillus pseudomycoides]|uniref:NUDIX domain-containing protein n=1 Tax=Bacillus pseudomycoides TaxID=64104 RepID=A0AAJ2DK29_9BACI|nr:Phosphohydrolase (MutT/nudix family) [Bacillus pseudomycoides]KFN15820.1 NUDIX domain protein [Bacillus pseudomycoides]MDR4190363.1 NUDIX domain-containing protein [Bacillus pseudomycoides]MDR4326919.1 NUDIX domain-containing protein [Bacillus pseudomycoides]PDZ08743.1 NUDIX domain-containing protein [Bacillus pseudomycoides]
MRYIEDMWKLVGNHPLILIGSHVIIVNEISLQLRTDFNMWGIIGGALEYGETLEEAAKREV